jgi:hypothetical protein
MPPVVIAQVSTPGNAIGVDIDEATIVVAAQSGGLSVIDASDPAAPVQSQLSFPGSSGQPRTVAHSGGRALVGSDNTVLSLYDVEANRVVGSYSFPAIVDDVALDGRVGYVLTRTTLYIIADIDETLEPAGEIVIMGSPSPLEFGRKLFVGGGVAYVGTFTGMHIVDVSEPSAPALLGAPPTTQLAIHDLVVNGSGLILPVTSFSGTQTLALSLYDGSDFADVTQFLGSIETAGDERALTVQNGLAYVAAAAAGIQVVNYLVYDALGVPPSATLEANGGADSVAIRDWIELRATVSDDVQVRNVEFLLDGRVIDRDGAFPFVTRFAAPDLDGEASLMLAARAYDTGGNSFATEVVPMALQPDVTPPRIVSATPDPARLQVDVREHRLVANELLQSSAVNLGAFALTELGADLIQGGGDDTIVNLESVRLEGGDEIVLSIHATDPLPAGFYALTVDPSAVLDRAGNQLAEAYDESLVVHEPVDENTALWVSREGGRWTDAVNWLDERVPSTETLVILDVQGSDGPILIDSNYTVVGLETSEDLVIPAGGHLNTRGDAILDGVVTVESGGHLQIRPLDGGSATVTVGGSVDLQDGARLTMIGDASLSLPDVVSLVGITLTLSNGATLELDTLESMSETALTVSGGGTQLMVPLLFNVDGSTLSINSGMVLALPLVVAAEDFSATVMGAGSALDLSNLTSLGLGPYINRLAARDMGSMDLSGLTALDASDLLSAAGGGTILAPNITASAGEINIQLGGVVDVSSLMSSTYRLLINSGQTANFDSLTQLEGLVQSSGGAVANFVSVTSVDGVDFSIASGGILNVPNLETAVNSSIGVFQNGSASFSSLVAFTGGSIQTNGTPNTLDVPLLADISGTTLEIDGTTLSLPLVTALDEDVSVARDASSLDLSNVTSIMLPMGGTQRFSASDDATLNLDGLTSVDPGAGRVVFAVDNGGTLELGAVTSLPESTTISAGGGVLNAPDLVAHAGDIFVYTFGVPVPSTINTPELLSVGDIRVQGLDADISLPSVTEVVDRIDAGGGGSITLAGLEALFADVHASANGSIVSMPALTEAVGVWLNIETGGGFIAEVLESFTGGIIRLDFDTSMMMIPNVTNIDNTAIDVSRGAVFSLPNLTSYTLTENVSPIFDITEVESRLDLSAITTLTINESTNATIAIQARFGGPLDLSGLTTIDTVTTGTLNIIANGANSQIDLSGLTTFDDTRVMFIEQSGGVVSRP